MWLKASLSAYWLENDVFKTTNSVDFELYLEQDYENLTFLTFLLYF